MTPAVPQRPPSGPADWVGPQLEPDSWTRSLLDEELHCLLDAASRLDLDDPATIELLAAPVRAGAPTVAITADADADVDSTVLSAVDPSLTSLAEEVRQRLVGGLGFVVVDGLPTADLHPHTVAATFLLLGRLMGGLRSQNADGHLLGHVRNIGADPGNPSTRIYQTNRRQSFHTDSCDAVGLLCLQPAFDGGLSMLVSVEAVYRRLFDRAPELASLLFQPVATDRRGEVPPGQKPWFEIPVLSWFEGHLTPLYQRQYIDSAARFDRAPRPDAAMVQALDLFDEIMNDPAVHLEVAFAPGDMQFVNNHALLHDRTAYVDRPGEPRHLLRLWLTLPNARPLPSAFAQRYGATTIGDRGGIETARTRLTVTV